MNCRHCNSTNLIRKGKRNDVQQYRCRCCKKYSRKSYSERYLDESDHKYLVRMHCEGTGTRSIARMMDVSHTCVMKTKLKLAALVPEPELEPGQVYQVDELATFIARKKRPKLKKGKKRKKNECWVAHAIDARTGKHAGFVCGRRTKRNLKRLTGNLVENGATRIYTDGLNIYNSIVPKSIHRVFERCTNRIERLNLTLRTHIKRLSRKTLCFSRSKVMLEVDIKLYFSQNWYWNFCGYKPRALKIKTLQHA